jgi:hypothetical protein
MPGIDVPEAAWVPPMSNRERCPRRLRAQDIPWPLGVKLTLRPGCGPGPGQHLLELRGMARASTWIGPGRSCQRRLTCRVGR